MNIAVVAQDGQSFFDIALQGGSIESVLDFIDNASVTDNPVIGKIYNVPVVDKTISNYYQKQELQPATTITQEQVELIESLGIGKMAIGSTFIIR